MKDSAILSPRTSQPHRCSHPYGYPTHLHSLMRPTTGQSAFSMHSKSWKTPVTTQELIHAMNKLQEAD